MKPCSSAQYSLVQVRPWPGQERLDWEVHYHVDGGAYAGMWQVPVACPSMVGRERLLLSTLIPFRPMTTTAGEQSLLSFIFIV